MLCITKLIKEHQTLSFHFLSIDLTFWYFCFIFSWGLQDFEFWYVNSRAFGASFLYWVDFTWEVVETASSTIIIAISIVVFIVTPLVISPLRGSTSCWRWGCSCGGRWGSGWSWGWGSTSASSSILYNDNMMDRKRVFFCLCVLYRTLDIESINTVERLRECLQNVCII